MKSRGQSTLRPQPTRDATTSARFPGRILATGMVTLIAAGASAWLIGWGPAIHCDALAPLTVLATLAAFIISICFRQMNRYPVRASRWFLFGCLLIAGATLFTDFRFVRQYRGFCNQLQQNLRQQMRQAKPAR